MTAAARVAVAAARAAIGGMLDDAAASVREWRAAEIARDVAIRDAVDAGASMYQVAKATGMSQSGVAKIVRKGGA